MQKTPSKQKITHTIRAPIFNRCSERTTDYVEARVSALKACLKEMLTEQLTIRGVLTPYITSGSRLIMDDRLRAMRFYCIRENKIPVV